MWNLLIKYQNGFLTHSLWFETVESFLWVYFNFPWCKFWLGPDQQIFMKRTLVNFVKNILMTGVTYFFIPYQWGSRYSRSMEFPLILIIHRWQGNTRNSFPHGSFIIRSWLLTFTIHLPTVTTVEELVNMASGKPVQLVYFDENNKLVFDHDGLSKVIESNNLCETPLALLPIGGAVRSGKSLLISLIYSILQYFASVSVCLLCKHE